MRRSLWCSMAAAALWAHTGLAWAVTDSLARPAVSTSAASPSVLLDVAQAGSRLVAVGERGIIVISDDVGRTWRQATVPTSVSLTAVEFPTPRQGWAVGHAGVVLHTGDAGETWKLQLDGKAAARLALEAAQAAVTRVPPDGKAKASLEEAQRLVSDGPDKPFLDLAFTDEHHGFIVGAYNLIFKTDDGGQTWQPWLDRVDNPMGLHLYAIQVVGRTVFLAGEQGLFLRSEDGGEHFTRLETPYEGTFFTVTADAAGHVVLAGLRGHVYWSVDRGDSFAPSEVPIPVSLSAIARGEGDTLYFANQAGLLLASHDGGRTLVPLNAPPLPPVASLLALGSEGLLTAGWGGVIPVALKAPAAAADAARGAR